MNKEQQIQHTKRSAVRTASILLQDESMTPEGRRLFALRTLEAAAHQVERIEKSR